MPNRLAKQLRNSPQLSKLLDGDGEGVLDMEKQQKKATMEIEKEHRIRENANTEGGSTERRTFQPRPRTETPTTAKAETQFFDVTTGDLEDDIDMALAISKKQKEDNAFKINVDLMDHLASQVPQTLWTPKAYGVWYQSGQATSVVHVRASTLGPFCSRVPCGP